MVSIKDISIACGVSVATVSKALNNHKDVGEDTKEKIRKKAREMGYVPNFASKALKTNRTYNIGVVRKPKWKRLCVEQPDDLPGTLQIPSV